MRVLHWREFLFSFLPDIGTGMDQWIIIPQTSIGAIRSRDAYLKIMWLPSAKCTFRFGSNDDHFPYNYLDIEINDRKDRIVATCDDEWIIIDNQLEPDYCNIKGILQVNNIIS